MIQVLLLVIKLFGLHGRMSYQEASVLLSKKIPEIGDQLINAIGLKNQLESKFNCSIEQPLYDKLVAMIHKELIISSIVNDIINQVSLDHSP